MAANCISINLDVDDGIAYHRDIPHDFCRNPNWGTGNIIQLEDSDKLESVSESTVKSRFMELAKQWADETGGYSVTTRRYAHPTYQAILALKGDVVPFILEELRHRPDWWFEALRALTRANPVRPQSSFEEAVTAWLEWGESR